MEKARDKSQSPFRPSTRGVSVGRLKHAVLRVRFGRPRFQKTTRDSVCGRSLGTGETGGLSLSGPTVRVTSVLLWSKAG